MANTALVLGSTCAVFFFSEIALRLFYPQKLGLWHETRDGLAIHRRNSSVNRSSHEVRINSWGMRDREHSVKKPQGAFRILVLGDSFMEALQVAFDESFPKLLEDRLRESGFRNVEVINAAVSGWGTEDELAYLVRYGRRLEPDLILVAMTLNNDVSDNMRERFYTLNGDHRLQARPVRETPAMEYLEMQAKSFIAAHSHLFQLWRKYRYRDDMRDAGRLLDHHVLELLSDKAGERIARGWRLTFQELAAIQMEGRTIGAETAVVLLPLSLQLSRDRWVQFVAANSISQQEIKVRKPQQMMISFGMAQGIEIIDLLPVFQEWMEKEQKDFYVENDGHWNRDGHLVGAKSVAHELLHRRLVKNPGKRESRR